VRVGGARETLPYGRPAPVALAKTQFALY
jgi:hypothetical protein